MLGLLLRLLPKVLGLPLRLVPQVLGLLLRLLPKVFGLLLRLLPEMLGLLLRLAPKMLSLLLCLVPKNLDLLLRLHLAILPSVLLPKLLWQVLLTTHPRHPHIPSRFHRMQSTMLIVCACAKTSWVRSCRERQEPTQIRNESTGTHRAHTDRAHTDRAHTDRARTHRSRNTTTQHDNTTVFVDELSGQHGMHLARWCSHSITYQRTFKST